MSIPTRMSLAGFIAAEPDLHFTSTGAEYVRVQSPARELYARFRPGDSFVASGYVHEYEVENRRAA